MTVKLTIRTEAALVVWRLNGALQPREIVEAAERLIEDPAWRPDYDEVIFIERGCELSALDLPALRGLHGDLLPIMERTARTQPVRSAIVADRGPPEMVAKLWRAVNEADLSLRVEYAVFTSERQALDWLGRSPTALQD